MSWGVKLEIKMTVVSDELSKVRNKNYKELLFMMFIAHVMSVERSKRTHNRLHWLHVGSVERCKKTI